MEGCFSFAMPKCKSILTFSEIFVDFKTVREKVIFNCSQEQVFDNNIVNKNGLEQDGTICHDRPFTVVKQERDNWTLYETCMICKG